MTDRVKGHPMGDPFFATITVMFAAAVYFMPTMMAWGHPQFLPILLVNLLLGWTFLGWVAALVWAFAKPRQQTAQQPHPAGWYPTPNDPPGTFRWWDGTRWTDQTWQQQTQ